MSRVRREPDTGKKKIGLLIFILFCLFMLIFTSVRGKYHFPLSERIVVTVLSPFQGVLNRFSDSMRRSMEGVWEVAAVYEQNKMLKSEVEQLRGLQSKFAEEKSENERLRNLLDYKQTARQFDLIAASVISRDPNSWTNTILINRGSDHGIAKDMAVVNAQGLVGSITAVFASTARVQLILDPRSSVGSIVQRSESRVAGIVDGNFDNQLLTKMVNIPRDADIVEGDQVITSGYGGVYPKGIAIGSVEKIENDAGGLLKVAVLKPVVDFKRIEEVMVIKASRELPPLPSPISSPPEGGKP